MSFIHYFEFLLFPSFQFTYPSIHMAMGKRSIMLYVGVYLFLYSREIASVGRSSSQEQGNGRQCYTDSSFNLEIIINHVKGMEILLASSHSFYASCALYWYSFFGLGAFFVFSCGKFLSIACVIFFQLSV